MPPQSTPPNIPKPEGIRPVEPEVKTEAALPGIPAETIPAPPQTPEIPGVTEPEQLKPQVVPTEAPQPPQPAPEAPAETIVQTEAQVERAVVASLPDEASALYREERGFDPADLNTKVEDMRIKNLKKSGFESDPSD